MPKEGRKVRRKSALPRPLSPYIDPLPGVDTSNLSGKLIVIEGPDAVGRSTQIARLRLWRKDAKEERAGLAMQLSLAQVREATGADFEWQSDLRGQRGLGRYCGL